MDHQKAVRIKYSQRTARTRAKVMGTQERPRLCVFRSHEHISAQIINDDARATIVAASDHELKKAAKGKGKGKAKTNEEGAGMKKSDIATEVGKLIAQRAQEKGVKKVVFDRGGAAYHGRIKALAEGARANGLEF